MQGYGDNNRANIAKRTTWIGPRLREKHVLTCVVPHICFCVRQSSCKTHKFQAIKLGRKIPAKIENRIGAKAITHPVMGKTADQERVAEKTLGTRGEAGVVCMKKKKKFESKNMFCFSFFFCHSYLNS